MPYSSVADARKRVSALKKLTKKQVEVFIAVYNDLEKKKVKEDSRYAQAIAAAKKITKSMDKIIIKEPNEDVIKDGEEITKATASDIKKYIKDAIQESFVFENGYVYGVDYDEEYVYFSVEYYDERYYEITYKLAYKLDGVTVSLSTELIKVKKETTYTELKEKTPMFHEDGNIFEEDGNIFRSMENLFKKYFGKKEIEDKKEIPIIKQFEDEEMVAIEPMYCLPNTPDGHGEGMDLDTVYKMVESANKAITEGRLSGGLFHSQNLQEIEIVKCWVNECDCQIGESFVPEGQPIVKVKFHDEDLWNMRKSGELKGLSIGAKGERIEVS